MSLPAWSEAFVDDALAEVVGLPMGEPARDWAWAGATGRGIKVAVIDSGIDADHPWVDGVAGAVAVEVDPDGPDPDSATSKARTRTSLDTAPPAPASSGDLLQRPRSTASACSASNLKGRGWGCSARASSGPSTHGMQVLNLSLSSKSEHWFAALHDVADRAYFRNVMLVCAVNNMPGPSYPSAVLVRDLGRCPAGRRGRVDRPTTPARRWSSVRAASTSRSPGTVGATITADRQQLRHPAHRRPGDPDALQASAPDPVPGEGGAARRRDNATGHNGPMSAGTVLIVIGLVVALAGIALAALAPPAFR